MTLSLAATTISVADTKCVSIDIPAFNILPDASCHIINSKIKHKLPDQTFLNELGVPAEESCFTIVDPVTFAPTVKGVITNLETGAELPVDISGMSGLTQNNYPLDNSFDQPFTAVSHIHISMEGKKLGSLFSRDSGVLSTDGNVSARLSLTKGRGKFKKAVGYVDEVGNEFSYLTPDAEPAHAKGKLCGKRLINKLFRKNKKRKRWTIIDRIKRIDFD